MTSIQPELWVDTPCEALTFYEAAFGVTVLHCIGDGDDIVAQLGVGGAAFWVTPGSSAIKRLSPRSIDGATSRTLLVVENADSVVRQAVDVGATERPPWATSTAGGSRRIIDPFGHEWEIGAPRNLAAKLSETCRPSITAPCSRRPPATRARGYSRARLPALSKLNDIPRIPTGRCQR